MALKENLSQKNKEMPSHVLEMAASLELPTVSVAKIRGGQKRCNRSYKKSSATIRKVKTTFLYPQLNCHQPEMFHMATPK